MVDKYLAWLNVNISYMDDAAKNTKTSLLQRRKARYKRDILRQAKAVYEEIYVYRIPE